MESQQAETLPRSTSLLDGWLTRAEVATQLGVSSDTLARWDAQRIGPPCAKLGRKALYRSQALREWLAAREGSRTPAQKKRGAR